mmetsp:Transcript_27883/g.69921  ORF Transcript_27883/g.69921 Transcript_27883/m.69921 type:complete len:109 (+) Transcript_27883:58-384(+)
MKGGAVPGRTAEYAGRGKRGGKGAGHTPNMATPVSGRPAEPKQSSEPDHDAQFDSSSALQFLNNEWTSVLERNKDCIESIQAKSTTDAWKQQPSFSAMWSQSAEKLNT